MAYARRKEIEARHKPGVARRSAPGARADEAGLVPNSVSGMVLSLQRRAGNHAVTTMLGDTGGRLRVGSAHDPQEHEADRMADQVVRELGAGAGHAAEVDAPVTTQVRRQAVVGDGGGMLDADTESAVQSARGRGRPLDRGVRGSMEQAFGADFSQVRMHTGAGSTELNDRMGAEAFTLGRDIFFRGGGPDGTTVEGQRLLAHELAHTVQQGGGATVKRKIKRDAAVGKFTAMIRAYNGPAMTMTQRERVGWIADQEDTTKENVVDKIRTDPQLVPFLRELRMPIETGRTKKNLAGQPENLAKTYEAILAMTFYHGTAKEYAASIRGNGLDPNQGGKEGGASAADPRLDQRSQNVAESKNRVFVTKRFSEAHGYAKDGGVVLRCFIPKAQRDALILDPRSQGGFFCEQVVRHVDDAEGRVPSSVLDIAAEESGLQKGVVADSYYWLLRNGAFEHREREYEPPKDDDG